MPRNPDASRPDPSGDRSSPPPPRREGFKDTAESVIIALILAFVFRAFVIEAFVIPTGSMASTLYGKHGTMTCSNCGWEYAYGLTDRRMNHEAGVSPASYAPCPNCGYPNRTSEFYDLSPRPSVESGDRILVLKWPLDIGGDLLGPKRWDVTVFKNPRDGVENFIKRLIGLPNEVLEIIDGDVYTVRVDDLSPAARGTLESTCRQKYLRYRSGELEKELQEQLSRSRSAAAPPDRPALNVELRRCKEELADLNTEIEKQRPALLAELDRTLHIARKTPPAQEALWSVVYDADYPPREVLAEQSRLWQVDPASNWALNDRAYGFRGVGVDEQGIVLGGPPIDDSNAYNVPIAGRRLPPPNRVSDLRVRGVLSFHEGDGYVRLCLSKRGRTVWVTFHADGRVALHVARHQRIADAQTIAETRIEPLQSDAPIEIALENVDCRVAVSVGGKEILFASWLVPPGDQARSTKPDWHATVEEIRTHPPDFESPSPSIAARDIDVDLTHLVVERDVYYSNPPLDQAPFGVYKLGAWGTTGNPILLRSGEYFMLGDNSPQSADSRLWGEVGPHLRDRGERYQLGTVPRDQLIGRAFFVYWPSGHRASFLALPGLRQLGWIPNVGRMRWIR